MATTTETTTTVVDDAPPTLPPVDTSPIEANQIPITDEKPIASLTVEPPKWPELSEDHPINQFAAQLEEILKEADHDEVYGIYLATSTPFQRNLILQKFLRANANDVAKARTQLLETLKWRKSFEPRKTLDEVFSKARFDKLGYMTTLTNVPGSDNAVDVITFNVYGVVKDKKATFGDVDAFMRWRVGMMELSLARLDLVHATRPIPDYGTGEDPYMAFQVHDYLNVSFLRQDPAVKAAVKRAVETFKNYYPETMSRKFFVNVPTIMGFFYNAIKLMLSKETVRKFQMITWGQNLVYELGDSVPKAYGGKADDLETSGETLKLQD